VTEPNPTDNLGQVVSQQTNADKCKSIIIIIIIIKVKSTLEQATKAQGGSRCIAVPFL